MNLTCAKSFHRKMNGQWVLAAAYHTEPKYCPQLCLQPVGFAPVLNSQLHGMIGLDFCFYTWSLDSMKLSMLTADDTPSLFKSSFCQWIPDQLIGCSYSKSGFHLSNVYRIYFKRKTDYLKGQIGYIRQLFAKEVWLPPWDEQNYFCLLNWWWESKRQSHCSQRDPFFIFHSHRVREGLYLIVKRGRAVAADLARSTVRLGSKADFLLLFVSVPLKFVS